ncbi:hypothetical protein HY485_02655 [Candidatus Woesearchaeota archaeon]|nr:hypothetical protein [Candidatus Woesearchaeota archaeon]
MVFPVGVDASKARLLTIFVARANKKRLLKVHALRKLHLEVVKLKKVSAKTTHPHIERFERTVRDALEEGGFIQKCKEPPVAVVEESQVPTEVSQEVSTEPVPELSREQKLEQIINVVQSRAEKPVPQLAELERMLYNLEKLKTSIKAKDPSEKEQLRKISERIDFVKEKITALSPKKVVVKHKKKARKR